MTDLSGAVPREPQSGAIETGPRRVMETSPDPIASDGTGTQVAVLKHPIHPMLVTFPIAFLIGGLGSDLMFLQTGDPFWARMSLWLIGGGTVMGLLAGLSGTVELLLIAQIRRRAVAWMHFVAAVMMLSVAGANWVYRLGDAEGAIWPWGLYLSGLCVVMVGAAGWLGGHLVFAHRIGIEEE